MTRRPKKDAARGWPDHHTSAETEDIHKRLKVIRDNARLAMEIHYMWRTLFDKHRETVQSKAYRFAIVMEGILRDHYLIVVNRVCDKHKESINLRHAVAYVNKHESDVRKQFGVTKNIIRQLNPPVAKHFYPITRSPRRSRCIQAASACGLSSPPVRLNHPSNRS